MKIQDIETFIVHPPQTKNWVFVKITTDNGIVGWGEAYTQLDRDTAITAHIDEMKRYLIGRDPMQIGHFRHWAYEDMFLKRGSMDVYSAVSGLEIAMWDITGKALDQPVYNLLGGAVRPALRVYGGGAAGDTPEECAKSAQKSVKLGYDALKFDPFPGPWRSFVDHADLELAAAKVGAVREAVGPRVEILIEVHRRLSPIEAIMVGRMIEKFRPYWFEEPCPPENIRGIAEVKNALNIPITIGEAIYGRRGFVEVFERRAADYLNPDISNTGGILEIVQIAAMAEAYDMGISPHGANSAAISFAAGVQASAVIPNFLMYEYPHGLQDVCNKLMVKPLVPDQGYVELPTEPGIGIEINEAALKEYTYDRHAPRSLRTVEDERDFHKAGVSPPRGE